jgi:tRNA G46 methylase TrmB
MRLISKICFGASAMLLATAANFPHGVADMYLGTYPRDILKREALKICQENSQSFVRFLASDREECYRQMRPIGGMPATFSGVWSKPDREHMQLAQD